MNLINLKLAFRNLGRNKLYTFINVTGLSIACAFCILTFWYVKNERSFDNFHKDQDRLFRVEQTNLFANDQEKPTKKLFSNLTKEDDEKYLIRTPINLAGNMMAALPQIQSTVRIIIGSDMIVKVNNESFRDDGKRNLALVDPAFLEIFNYPLLYGKKSDALSNPNSIVISERAAKKYFGYSNPIGQTIEIPNLKRIFNVSAVVKNFPSNSSFQLDILLPKAADLSYVKRMSQRNPDFNDLLIIKLKEGVDIPRFKQTLLKFSHDYYAARVEQIHKFDSKSTLKSIDIFIRPLADAHYNQSDGWEHYTSLKNVYQFIFLSAIVLIIACVNYVLLTLTNTLSRSQDVGVRKTIGADRFQIVKQYYVETQLLVILAILIGVILSVTFLPVFNQLTDSNIEISNIGFAQIIIYLIVLSFVLGIIAGIYPAMVMSGLKPLNIMRGFSSYRISPALSKMMLVIQFCVCIAMIISTIIIGRQMRFIDNASLGFEKDQVIVLKNPYGWKEKEKAFALQHQLAGYASTQTFLNGATMTNFTWSSNNTRGHIINGKDETIEEVPVDYNFFAFNKIPILKGRPFSQSIATDSAELKLTADQKIEKSATVDQAVVVNETLYKMLGQPPMGQISRELGAVIIGVCQDYHTDDLTKKIMPAYHNIETYPAQTYWIKIRAGHNVAQAIEHLHSDWNKMTGNGPFNYSFLDDNVKKMYDTYRHWMATIDISCFIAILIACLGLFGLSGIVTINRTKEIGIRKVLGATVVNLFLLVNKNTFGLVILAFVIASPIAIYLAGEWLENFAYRVKIDWSVYVITAVSTFLTAIIAVSYHTLRAASANPVSSLRNE